MKEHPIIFDAESVRAILAGHKWQTRRVVKPQPTGWRPEHGDPPCDWYWCVSGDQDWGELRRCPYGAAGDRLWVREVWAVDAPLDQVRSAHEDAMPGISYGPYYRADAANRNAGLIWRSPLFMPKWAARLWLTIIDVRVERLQDISEEDARAEGCVAYIWTQHGVDGASEPAVTSYAARWDSINGKRAPWASDPWVWVISFEVVR